MQCRRTEWLDPDDAGGGTLGLDGGRKTADEPTAADRDEDDIDVRHVVEYVEAERALPSHNDRIAKRVGVGRAGLLRMRKRCGVGVIPDIAHDLDRGAPLLQLGDLVGRDVGGQEDLRLRAENMRRSRDRESVIATRNPDDAAIALGVGEAAGSWCGAP